jgi:hypothetical protein
MGGLSAWRLGDVLITPHRKYWHSYETQKRPLTWNAHFVQSKQWRRDMLFGTWNVRSVYMLHSELL